MSGQTNAGSAMQGARTGMAPAVPGYALDELLGEGVHGAVWSATEAATGERRAVKVLRFGADARAATGRLELLAGMPCRHLVTVHDIVALEDGRWAVALDLADGGSLRDVVSVRGPLPVAEVVTALTPVASALDALHQAGRVHADVAPGNVLFTGAGMPMLADLDCVHSTDDPDPPIADGTPGFVAPEVAAGGRSTPAADVWALGALAWYALTGGSVPGTDALDEDATAAVGAGLARVITAMLDADPDARPPAGAAAAAIYAAAPASPVVLAGRNIDPATALTRRIRRDAGPSVRTRAEARAQARARRSRPFAAGRVTVTARRVPVTAHRVPVTARWVLAAVPALVVALVLLVVARGATGVKSAERPAGTASVAAQSSSPSPSLSPSLSPSPSPSPSPSSSPSSPSSSASPPIDRLRASPAPTLQRLLDARADALASGDADALATSVLPGSDAFQGDSQTIGQLSAQGQRYDGLSYRVRSAQVVGGDADNAVVQAVVDRAPYTVVLPGGARQARPAQQGRTFRYVVALTDDGWRLGAITTG